MKLGRQFKPEKNKDFNYGVWFPDYDQPKPMVLGKTESVLDKSGKAAVACPSLKGVVQFAGTGQVTVNAAVFEACSGRTTQNKTSWSVHPENYYLGLKTGVEKVEEGKAFEVTGAVVDWDGNVVADVQEVKYELLSCKPVGSEPAMMTPVKPVGCDICVPPWPIREKLKSIMAALKPS